MVSTDALPPIDILARSRADWNAESRAGSRWCTPVDAATIERARVGEWEIILTPNIPVPRAWFGDVTGADVLCLASGGGQQAPVLAAAGAKVTSYDLSDEQLARDRLVAEREGLAVTCVHGDMARLTVLRDASFDLIFHPVSNVFAEDVRPVWAECFRVLRPGGALLAGFMNPLFFLFDHDEALQSDRLVVKYRLPFSDLTNPDAESKQRWLKSGRAVEFSHSLDAQIGGQLAAGFVLASLYEDGWSEEVTPLHRHSPMYLATRAVKPLPNGSLPARCLLTLDERVRRAVGEEVTIAPYNPAWPNLFRREAEHLRACLPPEVMGRIEHFGSTAVPGFAAKPVVDMLIEVTDLGAAKSHLVPVLEAQGYEYFWRPTTGNDGRPYYPWLIKRDGRGQRSHHLHFVERDFPHWECLLFRDYLIAHPEIADAYRRLKLDLAAAHPNDREAYTEGKSAFIADVMRRIRESETRS